MPLIVPKFDSTKNIRINNNRRTLYAPIVFQKNTAETAEVDHNILKVPSSARCG